MVTMQDLYDEMKGALDYLGVRFGQMDQVEVSRLDGGLVEFSHGGRTASVQLLEPGTAVRPGDGARQDD